MTEIYVTIEPYEAISIIDRTMQGKISGKKIDQYITTTGESPVAVLIYEQYYARVENRVTLTAIIDKVDGKTHIRLVSTGGGQGMLFKFDWGASMSMENSVLKNLKQYKII